MGLPKRKSSTQKIELVNKKISLRTQQRDHAKKIEADHKVHPVVSRVLAARGYKSGKELEDYIDPTLKRGLPEPSNLKNLDEACELIKATIDAAGSIAICCDFDVDGLSGGAQIAHFLGALGVKTKVYVPDRFTEGYGLNEGMIRGAAADGFSLLITVDFGTTNTTELELAKSLGLKTIVVDHHFVGEHKPPATVFINPQQKGCGFAEKVLSAAGLAWYLLLGLKNKLGTSNEIDVRSYLDLACLGTICDMVPLIGANRVIAKRGLELLGRTQRPGLLALKNVIGLHKANVSCSHVSFGIGPRINAAGRIIHGDLVMELLTTADSNKAAKLARRLNDLNLERQGIEEAVKQDAIKIVEKLEELPSGICVWQEDFHTGVIGIVAQRLVEAFYRPSVVMGLDENGLYKGSVRGIKGFNVVEALGECGEYLIKFGGHEGAGGLSIDPKNLASFAKAFDAVCKKKLEKIETEPFVSVDTEVKLSEVTAELAGELAKLAPFGMGNPGPVLQIDNLRVIDVKVMKLTHLKVMLSDGNNFIKAMFWRKADHPALEKGKLVRIAGKPEVSDFQGVHELQMILQAVEEV